jgi:Zn-dependent protease with chaperone function
MTAALALLAGALVAGWLTPNLLRRLDLRRRDPALLIVAWLVSTAGVLLATATGVLLLLLPGHGTTTLATIDRCWTAIQHGSPPRVEEATGLLGVALLTAFTARLVTVSAQGIRRRTRTRQENLAVLRLAARSTTGPSDILWLAHDRPLAFSMAGHPGIVVATEGLTRKLDAAAVAAVLSHERAHLNGRHHLLISAADALQAALPFVPLFRRAPRAVRDLVEVAADIAAVRDCGTHAVRNALLGVAGHDAPSTALAMAQDAVDLRLARLEHHPRPPGKLRRTVSCGLTGITAAVLPSLTGTGLLLGITLITCPL